jgi:uracil phosphoribosyltransferase
MTAPNLTLIEHPILKHKLGKLRAKETTSFNFRKILFEISLLLAYEASRDFPLRQEEVETPLAKAMVGHVDNPPALVSILRAGNVMLEAMLSVLPEVAAGHIGVYRDKNIQSTVEYYLRLPENIEGKKILLLDPLLATADTVIACIDRLRQFNVGPIKMICLLASKSGLERVHHFHPDVEVMAVEGGEDLNNEGYLMPGIGDCGDRIYGSQNLTI